jgi:tetratricopeptide (TPR) repeat protein
MKKLVLACLFVLIAPSLAAATGVDYFHSDWETAKKAAEKQGKPVYVHFTTEWCGWCRRIEEDVYQAPGGKKALEPFVPVSLDCTVRDKKGQELQEAQENKKLMEKWGGQGYPFLVQVTPEGVVFNSWSGYQPVPQFTEELTGALKSLKEFRAFQEKTRAADPDSYDFNVEAMEVYKGVQKHEKALQAAEKVLELDPDNQRGNAAQAAMIRMQSLQKLGKTDQVHQALQRVQQFDPINEKGLWEQATLAYASGKLRSARSTPPAERKKGFQRAITALEDLTGAETELEQGQKSHLFLGILYAQKGSRQKAVTTLEEAVALDPDTQQAQYIERILQQLKKTQ